MSRTDRVRSEDSVVPEDEWAWIENTIGLCDPIEGEWLAERASEVPQHEAIVEIGSHTGQSTLWMASGSRHGNRARIWAVDPWPDPGYADGDDPFEMKTGDAVYERFLLNIRGETQEVPNVSYEDLVLPMRMTSKQAETRWRYGPTPIGLLFIDAIHTYEGVKADVELWAPYVAVGGWMALNDYYQDSERTRMHGAALVAKEILEPSGEWDRCEVVWNTWVGHKL